MAAFDIDITHKSLKFQYGFSTDVGGGRENQDEGLIWSNQDNNILVTGMFDGHGREVGKLASTTAKAAISQFLDHNYLTLLSKPIETIDRIYSLAHESIRKSFKQEFDRLGFETIITEEGYLVKKKASSDHWSCVHGGTSCTLLFFLKSDLYISNVGDSSALLCCSNPILKSTLLQPVCDLATDGLIDDDKKIEAPSELNYLLLTSEHSPESPYEFKRLRKFRSNPDSLLNPALLVIYDSPSYDKCHCFPVFDPSIELQPTQRGSYYKNVRKEWASLVSTPPGAKFQDALAFTRSLGDFHLQTYGISFKPQISKIDLKTIQTISSDGSTFCIVLATDGIWDNWLYEDVSKVLLDPSRIIDLSNNKNATQTITSFFVHRNSIISKKNFGSHADNATAILIYFSLLDSFASLIEFKQS